MSLIKKVILSVATPLLRFDDWLRAEIEYDGRDGRGYQPKKKGKTKRPPKKP